MEGKKIDMKWSVASSRTNIFFERSSQ